MEILKNFKAKELDFNDTFLSYEHLLASFPDYQIECFNAPEERQPPFKLVFGDVPESEEDEDDDHENKRDEENGSFLSKTITVKPYKGQNHTPYRNCNLIRKYELFY